MTTIAQQETEYHRNGVGGMGFRVTVAEGAVTVNFPRWLSEYQTNNGEWVDEYEDNHAAVSLRDITEVTEPAQVKCLSNCGATAWLVRGNGDGDYLQYGTFLAIHAPTLDVATAVLNVAALPDVRFGFNSWRGDHWHDYVASLHQDVTP